MESEEVPPVCCCWSAAKLRPTLGNPMDYGMPGSSVLHYLPELAQTDVHWVGDAIYLILCRSHLLCLQSFPAPGSFPMSWLFASGGQSIGVTASLEFQLQHQSFCWIFRTDFLKDGLVRSPCSPRNSQESSPTPQFFGAQLSLESNSHIHTWPLEKP